MQRLRRSHVLGPVLALGVVTWGGACGPPAQPGPPAALAPVPDDLAYGLPTLSPLCYAVADTARFTVDSGAMGRMSVSASYAATMELVMIEGPAGLAARARVHRLRGGFEAQSQGAQAVDERDIDGEFVVALDTRGRSDLVAFPTLSRRLLDVTGPEAMVRPLFVQLPGRPAGVGDVWVDTIVSVEDRPDSRSTVQTILTTTVLGDTIAEERTFLRLQTRAENRMETEGRSGGVLVRQLVTGTTDGTVIWDPYFRMLIERWEAGSLTGTLAMPGAGVADVPLSASVRRHVRLVSAGEGDLDGQADPGHCGNQEEDQG